MRAATRVRVADGVSLIDTAADGAAEGPAVLLLHGIGGNARSCGPLAEALAGHGHRVLAWDAPGYGESAEPLEPVDYPARVVQVLDELGLAQVDLFGTSWGGVIATEVAARWPERVRSLLLADSTRGSATDPGKAAAMRARPAQLAELGAEQFAADRSPRLVAPDCDPAVSAAVRDEMARVRVPGYRAAAEFMAGTDTSDLLPRLTVPTLVLVGEHDEVTGVPEARLLAERIPGARFALIRDAGHAALVERPAEVAAALVDFWALL